MDRTDAELHLLDGTRAIFNDRYAPTLTYQDIPGSSFQAKLQTTIPSGDGPHLFEWAHDLAGRYWESDFLTDMSDSLRVDSCQYTQSAWDAANWNGRTVGLPVATETVALCYNKSLVDDPPETLAEMVSIMADHHDPANGKFGLGYTINPYFVSGFAQAYGAEIYDAEADELGVTDGALKRGLRHVFEDLRPYMPRDPSRPVQTSVFVDGKAPFTIDGPWQLPTFEATDFEVGVTTLPTLPGGGKPRPYMGVVLLYFTRRMARETAASTAAREFAEWYTTDHRRILNLANNGGLVPVHANIADHPQLPEKVQGFARQAASGYPMPASPKMTAVWGPFGDAILQAFNSESPNLDRLLSDAAATIRENWAE